MADGNQSYDDYNVYDEEPEKPSLLARAALFFSGLKERATSGGYVKVVGWSAGAVVLLVALVFLIKALLPLLSNSDEGPSLPALAEITVAESVVLPRSVNSALGLARLKNPNADYGLAAMQYSWKALDGKGQEISSGLGTSYILPQQEKFILIPFTDYKPFGLKVEIMAVDFRRLVSDKDIVLDRVNLLNTNASGGFFMSGGLLNKSPYIIRFVDVVAIVKNPAGKVIAAASTQLNDLEPNGIKNYELHWPQALPEDSVVDIRSYYNSFADFNFALPLTTEPATR